MLLLHEQPSVVTDIAVLIQMIIDNHGAGPLDTPPTSGTAEAEEAAAKAHSKSDNPDDIMDALAAAEAKHNKTHPEDAASEYQLLQSHVPMQGSTCPSVHAVAQILHQI